MTDDYDLGQIKFICLRYCFQVIYRGSNVIKRARPSSTCIVNSAIFDIPGCNAGVSERIGHWSRVL